MGFMNKLNKMKNFLFDEEEIEEKPTKKHFKKNKKNWSNFRNIITSLVNSSCNNIFIRKANGKS